MNLLTMTNISKAFYGVTVLESVNFEVETGEIHALLGENGAGKSTLMNILAGIYNKDSGSVVFNGKELTENSIKGAEQVGIAFVHQELNILNDLKVYENLFLGKELTTPYGTLKKREMIREAEELFQKLGVQMNPSALANQLDTSKKQLLEIAKALYSDAKLFILDEPTTALNYEEIAHLFDIIIRLKKEGKSFIFISHKMPEIFQIADRYTILRNGQFIKKGSIKETTPEEVTKHMVGENYLSSELYVTRQPGEPVLELHNLSGVGFSDINFSLKKGEIVAFTGLQGAGCSEVMRTVFGVLKPVSGKMLIQGQEIKSTNITTAMKHKIAMVAANRKENSILPDMTILENIYVSEHNIHFRQQHIWKRREIVKYHKLRTTLNIRAGSPNNAITSLSGGNQQKAILARWLNTEADILLLDNPTQGIDVGAKREIYKLILELSKEGKSIIVNTLEIPEIQKIADRCIVFYHGKVAIELERGDINEKTVMLYATHAVYAKSM
ncbi:MAG: sugar transporter ATP-binding protein [Herbinix sp.]|jgi:ribose transport system ATP-binding protein|nr:sugar transporter ATP-binding protein [Herbinix sp.]